MPGAVEGTRLYSYEGKSKTLFPPENCNLESEAANKCINNYMWCLLGIRTGLEAGTENKKNQGLGGGDGGVPFQECEQRGP